ncbi:MAG: hypothetical protein RLZZ603_1454 [Actinomycetota bacterium]
MTKVLLTGASGYIGKHITLQLLEAGYEVRASVRNTAKGAEVLETMKAHLPAILRATAVGILPFPVLTSYFTPHRPSQLPHLRMKTRLFARRLTEHCVLFKLPTRPVLGEWF